MVRTLDRGRIKKAGAKSGYPAAASCETKPRNNFGRDCKKHLEGKDMGEVPPRAPCERGWGHRHPFVLGGWAVTELEKTSFSLSFQLQYKRENSLFVFFLTRLQARTCAPKTIS